MYIPSGYFSQVVHLLFDQFTFHPVAVGGSDISNECRHRYAFVLTCPTRKVVLRFHRSRDLALAILSVLQSTPSPRKNCSSTGNQFHTSCTEGPVGKLKSQHCIGYKQCTQNGTFSKTDLIPLCREFKNGTLCFAMGYWCHAVHRNNHRKVCSF